MMSLQAIREVLDAADCTVTDRELTALFMKVDANASGVISWESLTSFMLTLDEGTIAMDAAATMLDLVRDEGFEKRRDSLVSSDITLLMIGAFSIVKPAVSAAA